MRFPKISLGLEWNELKKFERLELKEKSIVFYAENKASFNHFKLLIEELTNNMNLTVCYVTSIKDDKKFSIEGVKYLYGLAKNNFSLIADKNNNIYLIKILNIFENKITKDFKDYKNQTNIKLRDQMYSSYDFLLSKKYKVKINQKTLERVKNYFK